MRKLITSYYSRNLPDGPTPEQNIVSIIGGETHAFQVAIDCLVARVRGAGKRAEALPDRPVAANGVGRVRLRREGRQRFHRRTTGYRLRTQEDQSLALPGVCAAIGLCDLPHPSQR